MLGSWTIEASTMRRLLGKTIIFCRSYSIEKHSTSPSDRFVFAATSNCEVIHGTIYSCLRAMFGLSVVGILVSIFSCMLVYQVVKMMVLLTLTLLMVVMKMSNLNTTIFDNVGKRIVLMTLMMLMLVMLMYNMNMTILNMVH